MNEDDWATLKNRWILGQVQTSPPTDVTWFNDYMKDYYSDSIAGDWMTPEAQSVLKQRALDDLFSETT